MLTDCCYEDQYEWRGNNSSIVLNAHPNRYMYLLHLDTKKWDDVIMVCFKSILRKAQAHSGQEFQPSRHWGQVNRFTYLGPRIVWLQGANNRWRCFHHLATSFWKSTFYSYKSCNISVADSQFQTLNCLRNMFAKPIYFNICWIVIRSLNEITDPNHFKICKYIIFRN